MGVRLGVVLLSLDGIAYAQQLGLPVRAAMTETPQNRHEVDQLRALLSDLGVTGDDFAARPLARRGFAAGESPRSRSTKR